MGVILRFERPYYRNRKDVEEYEKLKFVAQIAPLSNPLRPAFHCIASDGSEIAATDSRALLIAKTEQIPNEGLYEIIKRQPKNIWLHKTEGERFPDYKILIPVNYKKRKSIRVSFLGESSSAQSKIKIIRALDEFHGIDFKYFKLLENNSWSMYVPGSINETIIFENDAAGLMAIIAPIHTRD